MSSIPRLAHLLIAGLLMANAFFICYAVGLNLRTVRLDPGRAAGDKVPVKSSSYHHEVPKTEDSSSATSSREQAGSGRLAGKSSSMASISGASGSPAGGSSSAGTLETTTPEKAIEKVSEKDFKDLEKTEERLVSSLKAAADAGVLDRTDDKLFRPNEPVTRADFTRWMVRIKQLPLEEPESPSYLDVPADSPYFREIETATRALMVQGYPKKGTSEKDFKPDQFISRQEFAVMYGTFSGKRSRAEQLSPEKIDQYLKYDPDSSKVASVGYKDAGQINDWARKWVSVAQQAAVLGQAFNCNPGAAQEDKRFLHPHRRMTRAESINILVKLFGLSAGSSVNESEEGNG